jgi:hypothetical protein
MNQTKHCWQNYVDYHKCILAKGEDFPPCRQVSHSHFARTRTLAYSFIVFPRISVTLPEQLGRLTSFVLQSNGTNDSLQHKRWDDQREAGNFPVKLE